MKKCECCNATHGTICEICNPDIFDSLSDTPHDLITLINKQLKPIIAFCYAENIDLTDDTDENITFTLNRIFEQSEDEIARRLEVLAKRKETSEALK